MCIRDRYQRRVHGILMEETKLLSNSQKDTLNDSRSPKKAVSIFAKTLLIISVVCVLAIAAYGFGKQTGIRERKNTVKDHRKVTKDVNRANDAGNEKLKYEATLDNPCGEALKICKTDCDICKTRNENLYTELRNCEKSYEICTKNIELCKAERFICNNTLKNCTENVLICNKTLINCQEERKVCQARVAVLQKDVEDCSNTRHECTHKHAVCCLLYTSPSPRDQRGSRMPSSA
eukprot:TRINITY_DN745_c0_g1_i2.p1 TRINITY_DN745_c0_g1~~TRINITY_DN745_c0_g1_i2.p1  ORF type:complete len:234 (+),score=82.48 TRINITY_DN745_c0_g1_i2:64-765(+)